MYIKNSYYIKSEEGKSLLEKGKLIGRACWLSPDKDINSFENIDYKELRPILFSEEGKLLRNKKTLETLDSIWLKDLEQNDFEEIDNNLEEDIIVGEEENGNIENR